MNKKTIFKILKSTILVIISLIIIFGLLIGSFLIYKRIQKQQILTNIERVIYNAQIPFDTDNLEDITDTRQGYDIINKLALEKIKTIIPPKSKVRLPFESYCLDSGYNVPDDNIPAIFVYEKIDMPFFSELYAYAQNPNSEQMLMQETFWNLSTLEQFKFDDLAKEQQEILLKANPNAKELIDSYQYYQDVYVRNFDFGNVLPDETIPQRIEGSELYAKIYDELGYGYTELEVYNPTNEEQIFSLIKENSGVLVFVRPSWVKTIKIYLYDEQQVESNFSILSPALAQDSQFEINFEVIMGKFNITDGNIVTGPNGGAIIRSPDNKIFQLKANSKNSIKGLLNNSSWSWENPTWIRDRSQDKFQVKMPTAIIAVRG